MIRSASILLAACTLLVIPAHAMLFRCGNVFQDRPCDGAAPVAPAAPSAPAAPAPNAPAAAPSPRTGQRFAAACARTGQFAQNVQWKREGGATLERQMAELPASQRAELGEIVQSVYARRGSAPEIRAAVEAECVQRKEQAAIAAEQLRLLQQQAGGAAPAPGIGSAGEAARPAASHAESSAAAQADRTCDHLRSQRKSVEARMRAGGSGRSMETMQNERRDVEAQMSQANCS